MDTGGDLLQRACEGWGAKRHLLVSRSPGARGDMALALSPGCPGTLPSVCSGLLSSYRTLSEVPLFSCLFGHCSLSPGQTWG